ncbi:MAG: nucleotidyltransferase family protein, partial [Acetobacteraceae bacterium]|nr:nucleotidyltransferase family protein [Acetobacteraceae bacterium]
MTSADLDTILRGNPWVAALLDRFDSIRLPDCWIVAGALVQTVWNHRFGMPPTTGIADIDIVYFDPDLSAEAETAATARLRANFADLPVWLDVKNQARVHLWYQARFGVALAPYQSTAAAIATYPTTATAIGVRQIAGQMDICAPFGLSDLFAGIVRPNRALVTEDVYIAKTARWAAIWPVTVCPWDDTACT